MALSLGDGLRPGAIRDANDRAQFAELDTMGELVERARAKMYRHSSKVRDTYPCIRSGKIWTGRLRNATEHRSILSVRWLQILHRDMITSQVPLAQHKSVGTEQRCFCYVTPKEHLALPQKEDVRIGVVTYKIAAHAADLAKGHPGAEVRDDALGKARYEFRWKDQFNLSLDPERALQYYKEANHLNGKYCTMCGPNFCAMRISQRLKDCDYDAEIENTENE